MNSQEFQQTQEMFLTQLTPSKHSTIISMTVFPMIPPKEFSERHCLEHVDAKITRWVERVNREISRHVNKG